MTDTIATTMNNNNSKISFNWPVVAPLFLLTAIPGIPAIFLLALVAMGPMAIEGVSNIIHDVHFETPAAIFIHGGSGILFFLTMPTQFSPRIRATNSHWHKLAGRIAIVSAYVMAISGVWMHNLLTPESQGARYFVLILTSVAICLTFSIALWHIIKRKVQQHRLWMARAVACVLAAVTPIFVELVISLLFSQFDQLFSLLTQLQYDYGRLIGMVINLILVELLMNKPTKL